MPIQLAVHLYRLAACLEEALGGRRGVPLNTSYSACRAISGSELGLAKDTQVTVKKFAFDLRSSQNRH